ncbi:hypothetical protein DLJ53_34435 [Acuticoccus sediminis]|uniref:Glycosyltransferase 61 catalytic domain-containing protein n=1 Tax=Acuticoccus sediminis TaxID=2184697 RepID=A0A8B2NL15_9HYPH|nr:glycosyltransferase 61 family protein [Acuticoccus sediminis]RAH95321.1 hypothetical protein DLJ53_34435 [Acuticoccus sediminis]
MSIMLNSLVSTVHATNGDRMGQRYGYLAVRYQKKTKSFSSLIDIENVLSKQGWEIFYPEKHSVKKQLEVLASASRIAGLIGSAFHSLVLIKDVNADITIFTPKTPQIGVYKTIANVRGFSQRDVYLDFDDIKTPEERFYQLLNPEEILDTLSYT